MLVMSYVEVQNTRTGNVDLIHIIINMHIQKKKKTVIPSKESRRFHEAASLCLSHYKITV